MTAGRLRAIWIKRAKRGPMDPRLAATLVAGRGLAGNANQGGRRQVTILEEERWAEATAELGIEMPPHRRRANLLVAGLCLEKTRGRVLRIGACRLRVFGELRPCEKLDEAHPGLRRALDPHWRGGVCAEVLDGGAIALGDPIDWEPGPL